MKRLFLVLTAAALLAGSASACDVAQIQAVCVQPVVQAVVVRQAVIVQPVIVAQKQVVVRQQKVIVQQQKVIQQRQVIR